MAIKLSAVSIIQVLHWKVRRILSTTCLLHMMVLCLWLGWTPCKWYIIWKNKKVIILSYNYLMQKLFSVITIYDPALQFYTTVNNDNIPLVYYRKHACFRTAPALNNNSYWFRIELELYAYITLVFDCYPPYHNGK